MIIKCPLCQYPCALPIEHRGRKEVLFQHCLECDLFFLEPQYFLSAEKERYRYSQHQNTKGNAGYVAQFQELRRYLGKELKIKARVLDYACGPGPVLAELLSEDGFQVQFYDPYFFDQKQALLGQYQAITCTEAIEHFYRPQHEIEKLVGLLEPGGVLLIQTQFSKSEEHFKDWFYAKDPTHVCFFSSRTWTWIAQRYNLRIEFEFNPLVIFKKN